MKRVIRLATMLVASTGVMVLSGCEGDRGPAGPAGTTECFGCHTDDFAMTNFLRPYQDDFDVSQHRMGDTDVRTHAPCSRCHTNEGYQEYLLTGIEPEVLHASQIHCFTCHAPHTAFDFGLRQGGGPVPFQVEGVSSAVHDYDGGRSNTCATCHQARPVDPPIADGAEITSSRWGPHHSPQANLVTGQTAHVFSGATYRRGPSHNLVENGCVTCHMGPSVYRYETGGHTFSVNYDDGEMISGQACIGCHETWLDDDDLATADTRAVQEAFKADLNLIQTELFNRGFISTADPTEIPRVTTGVYENADDLGAIFNLKFLLEDGSLGIHNPPYTEDVIAATKAYLGL